MTNLSVQLKRSNSGPKYQLQLSVLANCSNSCELEWLSEFFLYCYDKLIKETVYCITHCKCNIPVVASTFNCKTMGICIVAKLLDLKDIEITLKKSVDSYTETRKGLSCDVTSKIVKVSESSKNK